MRFPPRGGPRARLTAAAEAVSQPATTCSAQTSAGVRACLESAAPAGCPPRPGEAHGPGLRQCLDAVGRADWATSLALESGEGLQFPSGNTHGTLPRRSGGVSVIPAKLTGRSGGSFPALGPELRRSTAGTHIPGEHPLPHNPPLVASPIVRRRCAAQSLLLPSTSTGALQCPEGWRPVTISGVVASMDTLGFEPSACEADVMPLHHVPFCLPTHACPKGACALYR